jgi:phenylalanyl-tRNA synthetase beta chain
VRIVLSWLRELCPVELSAEALGDLLAGKGMHVEAVERPWAELEGVVVARVLDVRDHPRSDRLSLARIDIGGVEREVVVGVRNMAPGDLVPYAGPGARVPGLSEPLTPREIRGVLSEGMLCSPRELAVSADHSGILVLDGRIGGPVSVGDDVKSSFGLDDAVLDLEIETNRPDELSVLGVAREVAGATGLPLTPPDTSVVEASTPASSAATVEVLDREGCPRYLARVLHDIGFGASPLAVQARLTAAGMRPVSNVVDATNYAMLELGQPMHAFDLALLDGGAIVVRPPVAGERLTTLDDVERELSKDDLVIADRTKAVAIAGVMGSAAAEVSSSTADVLLESATFEARSILRTSRRLGLQTEASIRFSRGSDPEAVGPAAARAAGLMVAWGGGEVLAGAVDVGAPPPRRSLSVRPDRGSLVLGEEVSGPEVVERLATIAIPARERDRTVETDIPSFRPDLQREEDLIEELARVRGYENFGSTLPGIRQAGGLDPTYAFRRRLREVLVRAGIREALSLTFASAAELELMDHGDGVRVANPPSAETPYLRRSLVPGLLRALGGTIRRGARGAALFEVGHVMHPADLPDEREMLAAVFGGSLGFGRYGEDRTLDVFDAKGAIESLLGALGIREWSLAGAPGAPFHPGRSAGIDVSGERLGAVGELHPRVATPLELPARVAVFELDVAALSERSEAGRSYRPIPRFPPVRRDLAFVLPIEVPAGAVREAIDAAGGDLVGAAVLFDVFEGPPMPQGRKSLAFSVEFRAPDRTLTDEEVDASVGRIARRIGSNLGGELRTG